MPDKPTTGQFKDKLRLKSELKIVIEVPPEERDKVVIEGMKIEEDEDGRIVARRTDVR